MFLCVNICVAILGLLCVCPTSGHQQWNYVDLMNFPALILEQFQQDDNSEINEIQSITEKISRNELFSFMERYLSSDRLFNENVGMVSPNFTASEKCINDTAYIFASIGKAEKWALSMIDAFGKPTSGLQLLQLQWVGSYEECIGVRAPVPGSNDTAFNGQYCTAVLPFNNAPAMNGPQMPIIGVNMGLCLPDSCSSDDMVFLLNAALDDLNLIKFRFNDVASRCQIQDRDYDTKAVAAIVVGILFAMILVIGTLYDLLFLQLPKFIYMSSEHDGVVNDNMENGDDSKNIKQNIRSDEYTPLMGETKSSFEIPQPSFCGKILLSFSMYSNGLKLLSTKQVKGSLHAVHGIRFLSMTWIILGHSLFFSLSVVDNFFSFFPPLLKDFAFQVVVNATVSVDTFFTLSGLLVGYLTLKELKKQDGKLNWFMFYFHRYWRLTPPYMLIMLLYVPLFPYLSNGPFWNQSGVEINQCKNTWWTNLLYVNNLVEKKEMCMGWTWYLANDMQFYVLSPLLILPLYYSKVLGIIVSAVFLLATTITAGVISSTYHLGSSLAAGGADNTTVPLDYFMEYYITPYCRMGPYIIGLLAGYYLYSTELRIRWKKPFVIVGWAVATASALAVIYGLYDVGQGHPLTTDTAAFYNAVSRSVWGACVCWVVVACVAGYGGPVNVILSWKAFVPLSRLTYCAYLIHPVVMYGFYLGQKDTIFLTESMFIFLFFAFLVSSYMFAFVLSLMFESPMMSLEHVIFKRRKR